jgi:hypothetical protein
LTVILQFAEGRELHAQQLRIASVHRHAALIRSGHERDNTTLYRLHIRSEKIQQNLRLLHGFTPGSCSRLRRHGQQAATLGTGAFLQSQLENNMPFQDVNNGLYNALTQGLGLSKNSFALLQPNNPVLDTNTLWNHYFNLIPPSSLVFNNTLSSGAQFFDNYSALNSALQSTAESSWETKVSQAIRDEFIDYLSTRATPPSVSQMPAIFRNWALIKHPSVANTGASALAASLLDPVAAGQFRLMAYQGDPLAEPPVAARQPDWDETFSQMKTLLQAAPARAFNYQKNDQSTDVSKTWSGGRSSAFFGLWGGGNASSSQSVTFAQNNFSVDASFKHVLQFAPVPGAWFSSATLATAYHNKNKAPWVPTNPVNWTTSFDPNTGNLARFLVNLIVVDTMNVTVKSLAKFSHDDQVVINTQSGGGLWPFYTSSSAHGASTSHSFDANGQMTVRISSLPGVPVILGCNVLSAEKYIT